MPSQTLKPGFAKVFHRPDSKPLPTPPTRSLTLSPHADHQRSVVGEPCPPTCNQLQSLLFKDFPLELRERVYRGVLGGHVCHIWPHGTSLCREDGKWAPNSCLSCLCGPPILEDLQNVSELRDLRYLSTATSFLRSCRRIYSEAIDFLYSENTFEILDVAGFMAFSVSVLPHRFDKICSLRLGQQVTAALLDSCVLNKSPAHKFSRRSASAWEECWDLIANMKNLQELFVTLRNEEEERLLAPLQRVSQPQIWHLFINWRDVGFEFEAARFEMPQSSKTTVSYQHYLKHTQ